MYLVGVVKEGEGDVQGSRCWRSGFGFFSIWEWNSRDVGGVKKVVVVVRRGSLATRAVTVLVLSRRGAHLVLVR